MAGHLCYSSIVRAVKKGLLKEPFSASMWRSVCSGLAENTYHVFLPKHAKGNPGKDSGIFERVSPGLYRLIRPIKYNIK